MVDFSVCAVLPAGGSGQRMAMPTPKQYCSVQGRELFLYTVDAFESASWIEKVVLVVSQDRIDFVKTLLEENGHKRTVVVEGGSSRHHSIRKGVNALASKLNGQQTPDVVLIHDVVRPFLQEEILREVAVAARDHGAAGAIKPLVSTVVARDADGFLECSLDRSKYRASEMPQGFRFDVIHTAYKKCNDHDMEYGTECLHLAQKYSGVTPILVETSYDLWKVTYPKDLYAAEGIIKSRMKSTAIISTEDTDVLSELTSLLKLDLSQVEVFNELSTIPELFQDSIIALSSYKNIPTVTERCRKYLRPGAILVHVCFLNNQLDSNDSVDLLRMMELFRGENQPCIIVNVVVCKKSSCLQNVAKVLSSLIIDHRVEYSGQVFFC
ncbi:D-ribitol-5-phosphate cytidylyltransferase-like [Lineus longissimus]|uniref:D-ribitol-5-phosphate cytidylyltransferase-like n=1 Tax=Lineus longissimus TaxID=88925 RepID=UPI002B4EBDDE